MRGTIRHWPTRYLWLAVVAGVAASLQGVTSTAAASHQGIQASSQTAGKVSHPQGITAGPDGAPWFTNQQTNTIGRITTSGAITTYTGTGISGPDGITAGPDGALWFTNYGNNSIGSITTTGTVANYTYNAAGQILTTRTSARQIQFGLKYVF